MWWFIGIGVMLLFSKIDDILEILQNKDPDNRKERIEKKYVEIKERNELIYTLKSNIGNTCTINAKDIIYVGEKPSLTARVLDVDEDWVNLEYKSKSFMKKETMVNLLLKTDSIDNFAVAVDQNKP